MSGEDEVGIPEIVVLPIDGILDLHSFRPADVRYLIPDYFAECRKRGILDVRIIHGKGSGKLQRGVHAILGRLPEVVAFRFAGEDRGGWGATLVQLRPLVERDA
ncbi:Smr domain-containing protein [Geoalkalibacter ferrihydriticus]|uniref:DNA mismatch repair protein MutS n=2 Tax=Geoalkalibacter ferrihydriticus TaxID=392333 RepID=A0A0C2HGK0_9BACT|nr:Smr/MutS family protein [Geoalkalibacter ferrihydriticus]KIH76061.1 DNA mismatch repair protein MutS [Geoalkalibacter ferrihydriticus DSM 17813]SDM47511.1 Smr domain-containing protein [Geoalkalibacter ferrihydriticus]